LCSAISTFTLSILTSLHFGSPFSLSTSATLKFGKVQDQENTLLDIPSALVIGSVCGVIGCFFIYINVILGIKRKRFINSKFRKVMEAGFFALSTSLVFFLVTFALKD
jgi:H+/Cl- antiporter ClcA